MKKFKKKVNSVPFDQKTFDYITTEKSTVASQEESSNNTTGESSPSALFSKFGGSLFGAASGSPQKVVTNIRGFLSNRLPGSISIPSAPDTGIFIALKRIFYQVLSFFSYIFDSRQYFQLLNIYFPQTTELLKASNFMGTKIYFHKNIQFSNKWK